jgi:uncharacterized protein
VLHHQLAWYVAGPVLGLCVVAIRLLLGERLGVSGGFGEVLEGIARGRLAFSWRGWFAIGVVVGAAVFALVAGGPDFHGYGWLTATFHGTGRVLVAGLLLLAGVLIGFGAKTASGCTSGNGLSGSAMASPASLVATAAFFATAIVVSFVIEALI